MSLQEQNIHDPALWPGTAGIVFQCFIWCEDQRGNTVVYRGHVNQAMLPCIAHGGQGPSIPALVGRWPWIHPAELHLLQKAGEGGISKCGAAGVPASHASSSFMSLQEQTILDPALWPGTAGIVFQCFIW